MRWVQIISRKGQWKKISTEILRDYMPDSNEKFVGKDIVRTAWRHAESGRNVHSSPRIIDEVGKSDPQRLKPNVGRLPTARLEVVPFPKQLMVSEA